MSKFLRAAIVVTTVALGASMAQAQTVAMAGEYMEANGLIVNIPQNPPTAPCNPSANDALCFFKRSVVAGVDSGSIYEGPRIGNPGAQLATGGLATGDAFVIPPLMMSQMLGLQVGQVLGGGVVRQLDTDFTAVAPGTDRSTDQHPTPGPAQTRSFAQRSFSTANLAAHGQNNGLSTAHPNYAYREAVSAVVNDGAGLSAVAMNYSGGGGFSGTAAILLDGPGRLYMHIASIEAYFPASYQPILATQPVGDDIPGLRVRNAAGWDYTVTGNQPGGIVKAFFGNTTVQPEWCGDATLPPTPVGCNLFGNFDGTGVEVMGFPSASSTKHMFPWTTGTVSLLVSGVRNGKTQTITMTGMGFDTTQNSGATRNIGLVAGSYTTRFSNSEWQVNVQMSGLNVQLTPEPGATIALISGLGLLGALAVRRRRG